MARDTGFGIICGNYPEYVITAGGKDIRFEMHPYCGPMPVSKTGAGLSLGPNHPFWGAVTRWSQQGGKVDDNGKCIWRRK